MSCKINWWDSLLWKLEIIQYFDLNYSYYNKLQIIALEIHNCTPFIFQNSQLNTYVIPTLRLQILINELNYQWLISFRALLNLFNASDS